MNILIVGLGLIGGSYAMGLKKKGHIIYGVDISTETLDYAIKNEMINEGSQSPEDYIEKSDLIIIGLYPNKILEFLDKYHNLFKSNQIITDVCGVKTSYLQDAIKKALPATYISHHPMAGREKVGINYANNNIFKGANFLICDVNNKIEDLNVIKEIGNDLEFGRISIICPSKHDKMIGFTSQLTHAIAVSLVNSDTSEDTKNFIGDSYRDLTRIAMINENLWTELFLANKEFLIDEITNFEKELSKLKEAIKSDDRNVMKEIFVSSRHKRSEMEK